MQVGGSGIQWLDAKYKVVGKTVFLMSQRGDGGIFLDKFA